MDVAHQRTLDAREGMDRGVAKARQAKSKARYQRYEELAEAGQREADPRPRQISDSGYRAERLEPRTWSISKAIEQSLRRPGADRRPSPFKLPPGGIVGVIGRQRPPARPHCSG